MACQGIPPLTRRKVFISSIVGSIPPPLLSESPTELPRSRAAIAAFSSSAVSTLGLRASAIAAMSAFIEVMVAVLFLAVVK